MNELGSINARILVVDDEESIRELLGRLLKKNGHAVTLAGDTAEARSHLKHHEFALLLCDIRMPTESGIEFIRYVSAQYPDTAIIMVTAVDDPQTAQDAMEIGVYGYIIKPFEPNQILIIVTNALRRRELEQENRAYLQNLEDKVQARTADLRQTVSELKKAQAQMVQSEKMASIGQLAAGVAHEINNPLGYISSNLKTLSDYQNDVEMLLKEYGELVNELKATSTELQSHGSISAQVEHIVALESTIDLNFILHDTRNLIKECRDGTDRIKKIVIDLKNFAHPGKEELEYADINNNLDSTLNVVSYEFKYTATVTKDYGNLSLVRCYPQQLNQVFVNLLVNAAQAIEKEGNIRIETREIKGYAQIKISDTGPGICEENISQIFHPFFTTKPVGKGTGLGLNVAYNIVKKHHGTIDVESEVGKGTTFTIRIPVGPPYHRLHS